MRVRLIVVWSLLLVLVGTVVAMEKTTFFDSEPPAPTGRFPIFSFAEPELGAVEVMYQGQFVSLMRDDQGRWFQHDASHSHSGGDIAPAGTDQHMSVPEQANKIAKQIALTASLLVDRKIKPEQDMAAYGLTNPQAMIAFYGLGADGVDYAQPLDLLYVGDLLPTNYTYYTMRDGDPEISLIPRYYIALLLALVFGEENAPTPMPELRQDAVAK